MPAEVLWPDRETLYDLMLLRATIGHAAFASEKLNDPINPELCEWPASHFDWAGFWFDDWPEAGCVVRAEALDPSKSKDSKHGDFAAFVRLGMDRLGQLYCQANLIRAPAETVADVGIEEVRAWKPEGVAVEVNQMQELFGTLLQAKAREAKIDLPLWEIHNGTPKLVRIRRIGPLLEKRQIRFKSRSPGTALLVQQLQQFPLADHDDGPDGLEMAYRLLLALMEEHKTGRKGLRRLTA